MRPNSPKIAFDPSYCLLCSLPLDKEAFPLIKGIKVKVTDTNTNKICQILCGHVFHRYCLLALLGSSKDEDYLKHCPACRKAMMGKQDILPDWPTLDNKRFHATVLLKVRDVGKADFKTLHILIIKNTEKGEISVMLMFDELQDGTLTTNYDHHFSDTDDEEPEPHHTTLYDFYT